ncbi:MAG: tRNA(His) guanylyltransferase Thg1 family protein [Clostridia bacterium]|nr:tRNA(His) guanylyltransferase Thg1 family protein [Clostridia bacterium]
MSNKNDSLGNRMKQYENVTRHYLTRKMPVIIRLDGKAFHSFTRGFKKPFDAIMVKSMQETMKYLCENIQGCVLGYTQSDEITLVLVDYQTRESDAWFDNNIQKMVSVSASMATMAFNNSFRRNVIDLGAIVDDFDESDYWHNLTKKIYTAMFDSRVFTLPKEEVVNCLIWRQQDATRNSIQSVGQANFSQKELHKKKTNDIQDMLMLEKNINWNNYPTHLKRGSCCIKKPFKINEGTDKETVRNKWVIDEEIPIFTQNKDYVNRLVMI